MLWLFIWQSAQNNVKETMALMQEDYRECEITGYTRELAIPGYVNPLLQTIDTETGHHEFETSSLNIDEPWAVSRGYALVLAAIMCITCIDPYSIDLGKSAIYRFASMVDPGQAEGSQPWSINMNLCDKVSAIGHQCVTFGMAFCIAAGVPQAYLKAHYSESNTSYKFGLGVLNLLMRVVIMLVTFLFGNWMSCWMYEADWQGS